MAKTIRVGNTRDGKAYDATNRRPYHDTTSLITKLAPS